VKKNIIIADKKGDLKKKQPVTTNKLTKSIKQNTQKKVEIKLRGKENDKNNQKK
jgi:hypothetical protein